MKRDVSYTTLVNKLDGPWEMETERTVELKKKKDMKRKIDQESTGFENKITYFLAFLSHLKLISAF